MLLKFHCSCCVVRFYVIFIIPEYVALSSKRIWKEVAMA
jgi:hypothetical protein